MPTTNTTDRQPVVKFSLRDTDSFWYAEGGLDLNDQVSHAMKFDTEDDAKRVMSNLAARFILPFEIVRVVGDPFGSHGLRWNVYACDLCGNFPGEMEDPTFDVDKVLPGTKPLWVCEFCAKSRIEAKMYEVVN